MRLLELEPQFVTFREELRLVEVGDGDHETWEARGRPTRLEQRMVGLTGKASSLAEAQGIQFLCPSCYQANGGAVGTHMVQVAFEGRGVPPHLGSQNRDGAPSRWTATGTGYADLTLSPSIDLTPGCAWHGHVTDGAVS